MTDCNSTPHARHGATASGALPGVLHAELIARPAMPRDETYLTTEQVAQRFPGLSTRTLENWRSAGAKRVGPSFIKVGSKCYYPLSHLLEWESKNIRTVEIRPKTH